MFIVVGGFILSWEPSGGFSPSIGWFAIVGACLCWALDNNLTQKISAADPLQIAAVKGLAAGTFNVLLALLMGENVPSAAISGSALAVGLVGYGVSLALFVVALREIGTARTSAYFSVAPFAGAALSLLLLQESHSPLLAAAGILMAVGVWLHLTERHAHEHAHTPMTHSHPHVHDDHHQHDAGEPLNAEEPHTYVHEHEPLLHSHPHFPDIHHRHSHKKR